MTAGTGRRGALAALGSALSIGVAGCLGAVWSGEEGTGGPRTPRDADSIEGLEVPDGGVGLLARGAEPGLAAVRTPVLVLPATLASIVGAAAGTDEPVRRVAGTWRAPASTPLLAGVGGLHVVDPGGDAGGRYAADVQGGPYATYRFRAERVESVPSSATVRSVSSIPGRRRRLATRAIERAGDGAADGAGVALEPQSPDGEWFRTTWVDAYWRTGGRVYAGRRVEGPPGDEPERVWYVLDLTRAGTGAGAGRHPVVLRLPSSPRTVADAIRGRASPVASGTRDLVVSPAPEPLRAAARRGDFAMTHCDLYEFVVP